MGDLERVHPGNRDERNRERIAHARVDLVLHRNEAGQADGYVRYRAEEKWEQNQPRGVVTVDELHALTDEAYDALWQFLGTLDLVDTSRHALIMRFA